MPRFDQRGPAGQGPMTGRRMGRCIDAGSGQAEGKQTENAVFAEMAPRHRAMNMNRTPHMSGGAKRCGRQGRGNGQGFGRSEGRRNCNW